MKATDTRSSVRGQPFWRLALPPLLVLSIVGGSILMYIEPSRDRVSLDGDLCPSDVGEITGRVVFLFDFTKPLNAPQASLPSELLNDVSLLMERNQELRLFSLTDSQIAPRVLLSRFCKPFANQDLQIKAAKDHGGALRDCDNLPAQLPVDIRESATAFCARREALKFTLDGLAEQDWQEERKVESAYLIDALEDIRLDLAEKPGPHLVYVFSDMMQHAQWYSHLDQEWTDWTYDDFAELMSSQNWVLGNRPRDSGLQVEVFYLPRRGWTDQPRVREAHQRFWRQYFESASVAFHNQAPAPPYRAEPLMNVLTESEEAARERLVVEQLLKEVREEQQELERQREETRRRLQEEQQRLEAERDRLRTAENQRDTVQDESREADDRDPSVERLTPDDSEEIEPQRQVGEVESLPAAVEGGRSAEPGSPAPQVAETTRRSADAVVPRNIETLRQQPAESSAVATDGVAGDNAVDRLEVDQPVDRGQDDAVESTAVIEPRRRCSLVMSPDVVDRSPAYPRGGRMNFGKALIAVRFEVDESGETVDDAVSVVEPRSRADRDRYFDLFAAEAVATVKAWSFLFSEPVEAGCVRRQTRTASFEFDYAYR